MISQSELQERINGLPRVKLVNLPTPLEDMSRLTELLDGPRLWVKREDCTGLAFGGNKERKAEFALGEALSKKADVVIAIGPVQSNTARAMAAGARKLGLKIILVLTGKRRDKYDGNLLLNSLFGAEIRFLEREQSSTDKVHFMEEIAADLKRKGHTPYIIPTGASYPSGAIAYVNAFLELLTQARDRGFKISHIVHAAGSGGTQAGLVLANKALGSEVKIWAICAEPRIKDHLIKETIEIAIGTAQLLDLDIPITSSDVFLNEDYVGEACEKPTPEALKAIKLVAQTEGILLDPIYTGRAMAGLINLVNQGRLRKNDNVVFFHTGGTPTLFPYRKELSEQS